MNQTQSAIPPLQKILCLGDSITEGGAFPEGKRWTAVLQSLLEQWRPGVYGVFNRGAGGNSTFAGLMRYPKAVARYLPGTVLIEFGLNDASVEPPHHIARCSPAQFMENLTELVRLVRADGGSPVLLTNHLIAPERPGKQQGNGLDYVVNYRPYQPAIREVAQLTSTPLIDVEAAMRARGLAWQEIVIEDGIHLQETANPIYAEIVFEGLKTLLAAEEVPAR